jgi:hypothetical protein
MKNLASILFLIVSIASSLAADTGYRVRIPFTTNPSATHTVTVNGLVKTFVSGTPGANEIQIGATAEDTALAYYTHLQTDPYDGLYSSISGSVVTLFSDTVNEVVTASNTGGWGTIAVTAENLETAYPVVVPLLLEPAAVREPTANGLVDAFAYATTTFPASAPALANFVDTTEAQTIAGAKTFTGDNTYQNSGQLFDGGNITNVYGGFLSIHNLGAFYLSNSSPTLYWTDSDATSGNKQTRITAPDGDWTLEILDDAFGSATTALQVRRSGTIFDEFYVGGAMEVAGFLEAVRVYSTNISGLITNASGNFTNAYITNLYAYDGTLTNVAIGAETIWADHLLVKGSSGIFALSNDLPTLVFHDTAAADTAEARWRLRATGGDLLLDIRSDNDASGSTALTIQRSGFGSASFTFNGAISAAGGFTATDGINVGGAYSYIANLYVEDFFYTTQAKLTNTTALASDPVDGFSFFASADEPFYRFDGSGSNMRLHNAGVEYVGAGTDYTLTTSYAQMAFGSGGNVITLPSAGTYKVRGTIAIDAGGTANDVYACKLFNATSGFDVVNSEQQISFLPANTRGQLIIENTISVTIPTTLHVYAKNITAARGSIDSAETKLSWVRLY